MKISQIALFTNGNTTFLDEKGEQIPPFQNLMGWDGAQPWEDDKIIKLIKKVREDKPTVKLIKWGEWAKPINIEELFALRGYGPLYWKIKRKELNEQEEDIL